MLGRLQPKVSVYLVNHNYAKYLDTAIQSVLDQTFQNFELIIIDDGSTDRSREIIERYEGNGRIVTIFQQNRGLNVTNNIALRAASGEYIMRLDADDFLDPRALAVLTEELDAHPQAGMVFPDYFQVDESGAVIDMVRRHDFDAVTLMDQPAHGACTMFRRRCLEELEGYDEEFRCQDGVDIWLRAIRKVEVRNVNLPLFYYRQHGSSLTKNERRLLNTRNRIFEKIAEREGKRIPVIGVVPVRGTVSDPRSIALEQLGDRKLIDWTLDAALEARTLEGVVVTTPDDQVLRHVQEKYGGRVTAIRREIDLARMNTSADDAILNAVEQYTMAGRGDPQAVAVMMVESPFRRSRHIDAAVNVLHLFETDAVVGVRPETGTLYRHNGGGLIPVRSSQKLRLEKEELFRDAGQLHVMRIDALRRGEGLNGIRVGHVVLDEVAALFIGSEWDWRQACRWASDLSFIGEFC